eukprot:COSAG02_NODE_15154_length_1199_cov_1.097273_2_plen_178_part_00
MTRGSTAPRRTASPACGSSRVARQAARPALARTVTPPSHSAQPSWSQRTSMPRRGRKTRRTQSPSTTHHGAHLATLPSWTRVGLREAPTSHTKAQARPCSHRTESRNKVTRAARFCQRARHRKFGRLALLSKSAGAFDSTVRASSLSLGAHIVVPVLAHFCCDTTINVRLRWGWLSV